MRFQRCDPSLRRLRYFSGWSVSGYGHGQRAVLAMIAKFSGCIRGDTAASGDASGCCLHWATSKARPKGPNLPEKVALEGPSGQNPKGGIRRLLRGDVDGAEVGKCRRLGMCL